jgi:hypothetical protein
VVRQKKAVALIQSQLISIIIVLAIALILYSVTTAVLDQSEVEQQHLLKNTALLIDTLHAIPQVTQFTYKSPVELTQIDVKEGKIRVVKLIDETTRKPFSLYEKSFFLSTIITTPVILELSATLFFLLKTPESILIQRNSFSEESINNIIKKTSIQKKASETNIKITSDSSQLSTLSSQISQLENQLTYQLELAEFKFDSSDVDLEIIIEFVSPDEPLAYKSAILYSKNNELLTALVAKQVHSYLNNYVLLIKEPIPSSSIYEYPTIVLRLANHPQAKILTDLLESTEETLGYKQALAIRISAGVSEVFL